MSGSALLWAWDIDNDEWVKVKTDSEGRLYTVAVIDELDDIGDVYVPTPTDGYVLYWNDGNSRWECKAAPVGAHKDTHDPIDGSDKLDTAIPVKVAAANAIGSSHSFSRADHVHEREHAKYTDGEAVNAMGAKADANPLHHDRAAEWGATEHLAIGNNAPHHAKYLDSEAKAAAVQAGAITDGVTKAPTHDAVYDVKATADAALPAANKYTDAEAVDAIEADDNLPVASITFIIDGGGSVITTGVKGALEIPFACTINRWTLLADQSGSIVVNIWKQAYADYPPEVGQKITGDLPPTISGAFMGQSATLTGWTTAIAAGDCLMFNVDSIATLTWVTLSLKVTKT